MVWGYLSHFEKEKILGIYFNYLRLKMEGQFLFSFNIN